MEKINDDELLNLLDGIGTEAEMEILKNKLAKDSEAMRRLEELQTIHAFLQKKNTLLTPSKNFTARVMSRLHTQPVLTFFSPKNGLLLLLGLIVASGLALMLLSSGTFDQLHTFLNVGTIPMKNDLIKIPSSLPFDLKWAVKVFLMINLVIAFVLLDRTILRPIFQKRNERFSL